MLPVGLLLERAMRRSGEARCCRWIDVAGNPEFPQGTGPGRVLRPFRSVGPSAAAASVLHHAVGYKLV